VIVPDQKVTTGVVVGHCWLTWATGGGGEVVLVDTLMLKSELS